MPERRGVHTLYDRFIITSNKFSIISVFIVDFAHVLVCWVNPLAPDVQKCHTYLNKTPGTKRLNSLQTDHGIRLNSPNIRRKILRQTIKQLTQKS